MMKYILPTIALSILLFPLAARAQHPEPVLLKDVRPGAESGYQSGIVQHNGRLYFAGNNGSNGTEPWYTDGSEAGTVMLKNIRFSPGTFPTDFSSSPYFLGSLGNKLLFSAIRDQAMIGDRELFVTDGTEAGTALLKNINPGLGQGSDVSSGAVLGNKLLFLADDGTHGKELWITDGTTEGTTLLKDIRPGTASASLYSLNAEGGKVYFAADDGVHGQELWMSDGTAAGTIMLRDICPGAVSGQPHGFTTLGDRVVFYAVHPDYGTELWITDGTAAGTQLLADLRPGVESSSPAYLRAIGNRLYFSADDGTHGREAWYTDGTTAGTRMLKDINPGTAGSGSMDFVAYQDHVFFSAGEPVNGFQLWRTDGTAEGTALYANLVGGALGSAPFNLNVYNNRLYFVAFTIAEGSQLWCLEGNDPIPQLVCPAIADNTAALDAEGAAFHELNGSLYFDATYQTGIGRELYRLTTTPYVPAPVSVREPGREDGWRLFPNPTSGKVTIRLASGKLQSVQVRDLAGRLMFTAGYTPVAEATIDAAAWPAGVYSVRIMGTAEKPGSAMLVKQ